MSHADFAYPSSMKRDAFAAIMAIHCCITGILTQAWAQRSQLDPSKESANVSKETRASRLALFLSKLEKQNYKELLAELERDAYWAHEITQLTDLLFENWAVHQPEEAIEHALSMGLRFQVALRGAFQGIAHSAEPEKALTFIEEIPLTPQSRNDLVKNFFQAFARRDPMRALALIETMSIKELPEARTGLMIGWLVHEPEEAVAWVSKFKDRKLRRRLLRVAMMSWSHQDFWAARHYTKSLPEDHPERTAIVLGILSSWAAHSADEAREWAERILQGAERDMMLLEIARVESWKPARTATQVFEEFKMLSSISRKASGRYLIESLPDHKIAKALSMLDQVKSGREYLELPLLARLAKQDAKGAATRMEGFPSDGPLWRGFDAISEAMVENDPALACDWAVKRLKGFKQKVALCSILNEWVRSDPKAASKHVGRVLPGIPLLCLNDMVGTWAYKDPKAARDWVVKLPEGQLSQDARDELLDAIYDREHSGN